MKTSDVLVTVSQLANGSPADQIAAVRFLESLPKGFLEEHPLPRKKVAPFIPQLTRLLGATRSLELMKWTAQLLGESGNKSAATLNALCQALGCNDSSVLVSAIWAIGTFRREAASAVEALIAHTRNPNRDVRWRAVWALYQIGPQGAASSEMFASFFADQDGLVRGYAVLGFISATSSSDWAIAQLKRVSSDPDPMPREHARKTIQKWEAAVCQ